MAYDQAKTRFYTRVGETRSGGLEHPGLEEGSLEIDRDSRCGKEFYRDGRQSIWQRQNNHMALGQRLRQTGIG